MTFDGITHARCRAAIILGAAFVVCGLIGCSGSAIAPAARERFYATREWPLSQGSVLTSSIKERVIDDETSLASIFVRHTRSATSQKPIEKLELRFANPGDPPDWLELQFATRPADSGGVQTFEFPFSAPLPHTFDFRATIDGKTEELSGWLVEAP
jgi:hypothetical protein